MTNTITPTNAERLVRLFRRLDGVKEALRATTGGYAPGATNYFVGGYGNIAMAGNGALGLPGSNLGSSLHGDIAAKMQDLVVRAICDEGNSIRAEIAALGGDAGEPLQIPGDEEPTGEERLAKALQNLLIDIEGVELPTHTGRGGISGAIDDANNLLQKLGFEAIKVTYRDMPEPQAPDAEMFVVHDGDLNSGFTLYGPYSSEEEASNAADGMNLSVGNVLQVNRPPKRG